MMDNPAEKSTQRNGVIGGIGCGCLSAVALIFAIFAGVLILIGVGVSQAISSTIVEVQEGALEERIPEMQLVAGTDDEEAPKVLRVKICGEIAFEEETGLLSGLTPPSPALLALRHIRAATRDEEVSGILLELDTPGGGVTESDEIWHAVQCFLQSALRERFVVVHMGGLCCSGGYYIASAANYIIARPTTTTGSIGVIMSTVNAAGLAAKLGVESVNIATGDNKAMLDPLKPVSPEHVNIFKRVIAADYERFVSIVAQGRGLTVNKVRELADGRVFCAQDALNLGLVDEIGYDEQVRKYLEKRLNTDQYGIYQYSTEVSFADCFNFSITTHFADRLVEQICRRLTSAAIARPAYR